VREERGENKRCSLYTGKRRDPDAERGEDREWAPLDDNNDGNEEVVKEEEAGAMSMSYSRGGT